MIDREKIYKKYNSHCAYCGDEITFEEMEIDHILPKSRKNYLNSEKYKQKYNLKIKNINDENNLNPACRICNRFKNSFTLEEFRQELEKQQKRAKKYSLNYRLCLKYNLILENENKIKFYFEALKD